jgi:hypothetical protein
MKYTCPVNPDHEGWLVRETSIKSPHRGQIVCAECAEHIKWASKEDMTRADELEAQDALLCPLMSGMVIMPAKSEVRPGRLKFEGVACLEERCAWYVKVNEDCSIPDIAISLGTITDWRLVK